MLGIGSLLLKSVVLMDLRSDLFTALGFISCLYNMLIFLLFILYLWILDIAQGFRARYVLLCLMLSQSSFSSLLE